MPTPLITINPSSACEFSKFYNLLAFISALIISNSMTSTANEHEFPHQALLGYDGDNPFNYAPRNEIMWLCGGSLISRNFVLTGRNSK